MLAAYFFLARLARLPSSKILTFKSLLSGFLLPTLVYSLLQFIHSLGLLISTMAVVLLFCIFGPRLAAQLICIVFPTSLALTLDFRIKLSIYIVNLEVSMHVNKMRKLLFYTVIIFLIYLQVSYTISCTPDRIQLNYRGYSLLCTPMVLQNSIGGTQ